MTPIRRSRSRLHPHSHAQLRRERPEDSLGDLSRAVAQAEQLRRHLGGTFEVMTERRSELDLLAVLRRDHLDIEVLGSRQGRTRHAQPVIIHQAAQLADLTAPAPTHAQPGAWLPVPNETAQALARQIGSHLKQLRWLRRAGIGALLLGALPIWELLSGDLGPKQLTLAAGALVLFIAASIGLDSLDEQLRHRIYRQAGRRYLTGATWERWSQERSEAIRALVQGQSDPSEQMWLSNLVHARQRP